MRKNFLLLIIIACTAFASCTKDEESIDGGGRVSHTMIMYMMADNNLSSYIDSNVKEVVKSVGADFSRNGRIVLYYDTSDSTVLYELKNNDRRDNDYIKRLNVLKTYEKRNSASPSVMKSVMEDIKTLVPSDSYGILFSGHGSGWFPKYSSGTSHDSQKVQGVVEHDWIKDSDAQMTRWYGYDGYYRDDACVMVGADLIEGLSPIHFDYIAFDACFMASVELMYELRSYADYIVASPVEIMGRGYPYDAIIPAVFEQSATIKNVAEIFVNYYSSTNMTERSGAMTVVDCSQMDALAQSVKKIMNSQVNSVAVSTVQHLDMLSNHAFFDLNSYLSQLCADDQLYADYLTAYAKAVIYHGNTDTVYSAYGSRIRGYYVTSLSGGKLQLCGLSTYIPRDEYPVTKTQYLNTDWAKYIYDL